MDHIDHALGRPVDPMAESHRNHFATDADSEQAEAFAASPYWDTHGRTTPGQMAFFFVNRAGRQALKDHLKQIGDKHRLFDVTYKGMTQSVVAETAAKAKYSLWVNISDCFCDLKFGQFARTVSVRLSPKMEPA
ncbi:hypothetical protein [Agrobacterium rosae]|uniref:hypothetical protein n=1 Tax=Agrobacterium rosae TaxID=1972867 RepID=UPI001FEF3E51|nr:hypothetical protein [Agrobacterium rosae]